MKVVLIVNPVLPFPPKTIGGTERIVQYLMDELVARGHDVTLLGHNDSIVPNGVKLVKIGTYLDQKNTNKTVWKYLLLNKFDVIHNHGRLIYFLPRVWSNTRKVHTFHMAALETKSFHRFINLKPRNLIFSPCAKWIQEKHKHIAGWWQYVNNAVPEHKYRLENKMNNPYGHLIIISRISPTKGLPDAIEIAKKTGKKLIIAGNIGDYPHEIQWFKENIEPINDGKQVSFVGPVNDAQKQQLLNDAAALLMLTTDSEAFNITMIEANACGCPVISYNRFCLPDFIEPGINGFIGNTQADLIEAVARLGEIDRTKCREVFEKKYTARLMADNYLNLYTTPDPTQLKK